MTGIYVERKKIVCGMSYIDYFENVSVVREASSVK